MTHSRKKEGKSPYSIAFLTLWLALLTLVSALHTTLVGAEDSTKRLVIGLITLDVPVEMLLLPNPSGVILRLQSAQGFPTVTVTEHPGEERSVADHAERSLTEYHSVGLTDARLDSSAITLNGLPAATLSYEYKGQRMQAVIIAAQADQALTLVTLIAPYELIAGAWKDRCSALINSIRFSSLPPKGQALGSNTGLWLAAVVLALVLVSVGYVIRRRDKS